MVTNGNSNNHYLRRRKGLILSFTQETDQSAWDLRPQSALNIWTNSDQFYFIVIFNTSIKMKTLLHYILYDCFSFQPKWSWSKIIRQQPISGAFCLHWSSNFRVNWNNLYMRLTLSEINFDNQALHKETSTISFQSLFLKLIFLEILMLHLF